MYPLQQHEQSSAVVTCGNSISLGNVESSDTNASDGSDALAHNLMVGAWDTKASTTEAKKKARDIFQKLTPWWADGANKVIPDDGSETRWVGELAFRWANNPLSLAVTQNRLSNDFNPAEVKDGVLTGRFIADTADVHGNETYSVNWKLTLLRFLLTTQMITRVVVDMRKKLYPIEIYPPIRVATTPMVLKALAFHARKKLQCGAGDAPHTHEVESWAISFTESLLTDDQLKLLTKLGLLGNLVLFIYLLGEDQILDLLSPLPDSVPADVVLTMLIEGATHTMGIQAQTGITGDNYIPLLMYDVQLRKTVSKSVVPADSTYVIISHSWGQLPDLQWAPQSGLAWKVPAKVYPVMEKEAVRLATQVGTDYAWFDLACIPQQGDDALKATIIKEQGRIFRGAKAAFGVLHSDAGEWLSHINFERPPTLGEIGAALKSMSDSLWLKSTWTLQEAWLRPDMMLCVPYGEPRFSVGQVGLWLRTVRTLIHFGVAEEHLSNAQAAVLNEVVTQVGFDSFASINTVGALAAAARRRAKNPEDEYNAVREIFDLKDYMFPAEKHDRALMKARVSATLFSRGDPGPFMHDSNRHVTLGCPYHHVGTHIMNGATTLVRSFTAKVHFSGTGMIVDVATLVEVESTENLTGSVYAITANTRLMLIGEAVVPKTGEPAPACGLGLKYVCLILNRVPGGVGHFGGYVLMPPEKVVSRKVVQLGSELYI